MNNDNSYEVILSGTTTKTVTIDILDDRWTIKDILRADDFPMDVWPCSANEWSGEISIDGSVVARYFISEADSSEEVEEVITADGEIEPDR